MQGNIRPETMERITTTELANAFIDEQVKELKEQIGDKKVLLALSGGVDSSVVAALLIKAIGQQLVCVHVNHGLLRKGEPEQVIEVFRNQMNANLVYVDAVDRFLDKLAGVAEPEKKRKIIGAEFIRVFEEEARKQDGIEFLAQGTIYPDILESDGVKAHHNVGGLPEDLQFELVEPVKLLFKDEVRVVGKALGLPDAEKNILNLVCYKLLEAVSEPYEYIGIKVIGDIGGHEFSTTGKEDVRCGFKAIDRVFRRLIDKPEKEPVSLPSINEKDVYQVFDISTKSAKTQPPKRFTEDALLSAMETCGKNLSDDELKLAMKERGLGTPATRASIIDNLIKKGFIERSKGKLISTSKGRIFISKVVPKLRDPAMTAQWEKAISEIRNGNYNPNEFMANINKFVQSFFNFVKTKEIDDPDAFKRDRVVGKCPFCGSDVSEMKMSYSCENKDCKFVIWKNIQKNNTKKISKSNAVKLLSKGKSDLVKGLKSAKGTEFSAYLVLDRETGSIRFEYPTNKSKGGGNRGNGYS